MKLFFLNYKYNFTGFDIRSFLNIGVFIYSAQFANDAYAISTGKQIFFPHLFTLYGFISFEQICSPFFLLALALFLRTLNPPLYSGMCVQIGYSAARLR